MAYTTSQYNTLVEAIAQGAVRVKYGDKEVEYRSLNEMKRIKHEMEIELFPNRSTNGRTYGSFSKGLR